MGIAESISAWFGHAPAVDADAPRGGLSGESRDAARLALQALWLGMRPGDATVLPAGEQANFQTIDTTLKNQAASWNDLNLAEQLLVGFMPEEVLDESIARRLTEAQRRQVPDAADNAARLAALATPVALATRRAFLVGLVSDIQHFGLRSMQVRRLRADAVRFISTVSLAVMFVVVVPFLCYLLHQFWQETWLDRLITRTITAFPNYGLYTAVSFGLLGALFSRFLQLQKNYLAIPIDDADTYYRRDNILLRLFIGTVAAVIVYFVAASKLIGGDIVPDITQLSFEPVHLGDSPSAMTVIGTATTTALVPARNLALLVIWSFLAGFSEQLVPDLLSTTATRIGSSAGGDAAADK